MTNGIDEGDDKNLKSLDERDGAKGSSNYWKGEKRRITCLLDGFARHEFEKPWALHEGVRLRQNIAHTVIEILKHFGHGNH